SGAGFRPLRSRGARRRRVEVEDRSVAAARSGDVRETAAHRRVRRRRAGRRAPRRSVSGAPCLLLAGASVRAQARSALAGAAAGALFPGGIVAVDYFADHDLTSDPRVTPVSIARDLGLPRTTAGLGRALIRLCSAGTIRQSLAWAGGLENRPALLRRLAKSVPLLGNEPAVVAAVRNPALLFAALRAAGLRHPDLPRLDAAPRDGRRWLFKRRRS